VGPTNAPRFSLFREAIVRRTQLLTRPSTNNWQKAFMLKNKR